MDTIVTAPPIPQKGGKRWLLASVLFVLVAAVGVAVYWYFAIYAQTPERVFARMLSAMHGVTAMTADVTLEGNGRGVPTSGLYVPKPGAFTTAVDTELFAHALMHIDQSENLFSMNFSLSAKADGEERTTFAGDMRSIGDTDYVQMTALTSPIIPSNVMDGVSVALNRWIVIDKTQLAESLHMSDILAQVEVARTVEQQNGASLARALPKIVVITATLPRERVGDVDAYHYTYSIDKNAMGDFLTTLGGTSNDDFAQIRALLGETNDITGDLWIAASDARLAKFTVDTVMKGTQRFVVHGTVVLSDIGGAVSVTAPETSAPLEDVMVEVLTKVSEVANADDDNDGLTNAKEATYGTDVHSVDTDGDGFSDGDEVKNGYNPAGAGKL